MKKIDFLATDGLKLNGLLYESNQKTDKVILSVHGMSSNCLKNREDILSKCMNQNNIDYFCFSDIFLSFSSGSMYYFFFFNCSI